MIPHHEPGLRRIAERLLRNSAEEDDAIQEMWLAALQDKEHNAHSMGWQAQTLRHRAMRMWGQRRRRAEEWESVEGLQEVAGSLPAPDAEIERTSLRELLSGVIDQLPEGQAEVIRARFFEELSNDEFAARAGLPLTTVRTRLYRGLAEMRRRLNERIGDPRLTAVALIRGLKESAEDTRSLANASGVTATGSAGLALGIQAFAAALVLILVGAWFSLPGGTAPVLAQGLLQEDAMATALTVQDLVSYSEDKGTPRLLGGKPAIPATDLAMEGESAPPLDPVVPVTAPDPDSMVLVLRVTDAWGTPIPGAVLSALGLASRYESTSGQDGVLRWVGGREHLADTQPSFRSDDTWESSTGSTQQLLVELRHPEAAQLPRWHVDFAPGTVKEIQVELDFEPAELRGRVLDRLGNPIAGAELEIDRIVSEEWIAGVTQWEYRKVRSDHQGRYRLEQLLPGSKRFGLLAEGYVRQAYHMHFTAGEKTERDFVLDRAARVVGVVEDEDGYPVEGATVFADTIHFDPTLWATTESDGSYELVSLAAGEQRLSVYGPAGTELARHGRSERVELKPEGTVWNPVLEPCAGVRVQLLDPDGGPARGYLLRFDPMDLPSREDWIELQVTGPQGLAEVAFPPGPLRISVHGVEQGLVGPAALRTWDGLEGRSELYRLELRAEDLEVGSVKGTVLTGRGGALPGDSTLYVLGAGMKRAAILPHHQGGTFELCQMPSGSYTMVASIPHRGSAAFSFDLEPRQVLKLGNVSLPAPGRLVFLNDWPKNDSGGRSYEIQLGSHHHETPMGLYGIVNTEHARPIPKEPLEWLPGEAWVRVLCGGEEVQRAVVQVRSGEVTNVHLGPGRN